MKKFFGLLGLLLATSVVSAQNDDRYILSAGSAMGATGTQVSISINLDSVTGAAGAPVNLQGWSYGVCSDSTVAAVFDVVDGATTATVNNGAVPAFNSINIAPVSTPPFPAPGPNQGFTIGVVIDLFGNFTLAPGTGYELNVATYDMVGAAGDSTALDFCDVLATPPVETLIVEMGGASAIPVQNSGLLEVPAVVGGPELTLNCSSATGNVGSQVTLTVSLEHDMMDAEGFSFGLTHDASIATLSSIDEGAASLATNTAGGAAFFHSDAAPTLPAGTTGGGFVGAVISLAPPFDAIPGTDVANGGAPSEIATFTYDVILDGTTSVDFSGAVGDPAVAIIVSVGGASEAPDPGNLNGGSITGVAVAGDLFVRGDANNDDVIDVSDVVYLAKALFGVGPALECDAAGDTNDNDTLDSIEDPMYLLMYLFQGGPAPATPFPTCDLDATNPGALTCANSSCP